VIPLRDANPTRRTSVVTIGIVVACFVVFAYELGLLASGGEDALDAFVTRWGVVPAELTAAWGHGDFLSMETATLITSQFMHAGWLHLLGNMLYLWIFANNVEDRLGRIGFLLFYLTGGVAFFAHIGGFVAGAVVARVLAGFPGRPGRPPAPAAVG
jgi:membrane associated rhomboid family serine protease